MDRIKEDKGHSQAFREILCEGIGRFSSLRCC